MTLTEKYARLSLHLTKGVGSKIFLKILDRFGSAADFLRRTGNFRYIKLPAANLVKNISSSMFVVYGENDYPKLLAEIPDFPLVLFYRGDLALLNKSGIISIVGTRNFSSYGSQLARKFTRELVDLGFTVASGMALGIDSIVHREVLAAGGKTVAVLGTSINDPSPRTNWYLYRQILADKGLVISEYFYPPTIVPGIFPRRNRIIAGLSPATLVIEAPEKSGALITADLAFNYNREVFVCPSALGLASAAGNLKLIKANQASLLTEVNDLFAAYHLQNAAENGKTKLVLDKKTAQAVKVLQQGSFDLHYLARQLSLSYTELAKILAVLEVKKIVERDCLGRYTLIY